MTARQREVLACAADGLDVNGTARRLYLTADTVKTHRRKVMRALGVGTMREAVAVTRPRVIVDVDRLGRVALPWVIVGRQYAARQHPDGSVVLTPWPGTLTGTAGTGPDAA